MPKTDNVGHPYPARRERPHFEKIVSFFESVDSEDFAGRDQWNVSVVPDGSISVDASGGVTWSDKIVVHHASTGWRGEIPAEPSDGVTLEDGDVAFLRVVRGPQGVYTGELEVASGDIPNTQKAVAMMYRRGDLVWIRQYGAIRLGQTLSPAASTPIASGDAIRDNRQLAVNEHLGEGVHVVGRFSFEPDQFDLSNSTIFEIEFAVEAQVTIDGQSADVTLFDDEEQAAVHTFTFDSDQPTRKSTTITPFEDSALRPYEVRAGMQTGQDGELFLMDANLEFINSF